MYNRKGGPGRLLEYHAMTVVIFGVWAGDSE